MVDTTKWRCDACWEIWLESEILTAPNPFDATDILSGCPKCKSVNDWREVCEWMGCKKDSSSGTPLVDGRYVRRCWEHRPEAVGEKIKGAV